MPSFIWHVWVDWDGDGVAETDEGGRLRGLTIERGRETWLDDPFVGRADLVLVNHDRRYDNWYVLSPLYGQVRAGRKVALTVEYNGTTYPLFSGRVELPRQSGIRAAGAPGDEWRLFRLTVHDGWQWLRDHRARVELMTNTTTKAAITCLLQAVAWSPSGTAFVIDSSAIDGTDLIAGLYDEDSDLGTEVGDTIPYWWVEDEDVAQNLFDLIASNWGYAHIDWNGQLVFRSRNDTADLGVDYTLVDAEIQEMTVDEPWDEISNHIEIRAAPRTIGSVTAIWVLNEVIALQPGQAKTFGVRWADATGAFAPATSVITPAATTDYTANDNSDGTGTDRTAEVTVAITVYSNGADVVVTSSAAAPVYLTLLQVRGQLVEALDSAAQVADDAISQADNGYGSYERDLRWQQSTIQAQSIAEWALSYLKDSRQVVEVKFEHNLTALAYDLHSKIADGTTQGPGGNFRLVRITHEMNDANGQELHTTWKLVRGEFEHPFIVDASAVDGTDQLGV